MLTREAPPSYPPIPYSRLSLFLYNLALRLYSLLAWVLSPVQPKAAKWVKGRQRWSVRLRAALAGNTDPVIWMHCASLGEFEQGRPILEALREQYGTRVRILLTFFSPSGYEVRHNWPGADYVFYLPLDSAASTARFVDIVQPAAAIFVKYEFWYYYLHLLKRHHVPTYLIAAALRPDQIFFKPWGGLFRSVLHCFTHIFTQNEASVELLKTIGITTATMAGDPRFDRVRGTAQENKRLSLVNEFAATNEPILVVGSSWPEDIKVLAPAIQRHAARLKVIIAPHEIGPTSIAGVEAAVSGALSIRYSQAAQHANGPPEDRAVTSDLLAACRVLIIDNIGLLSSLYGYATVAYVGGAFGKGLHNVLEAAVFGAPVLFGPRIQRFPEAGELIAAGGARSVASAEELDQYLTQWLDDRTARLAAGSAAAAFIYTNAGATARIMAFLVSSFALPANEPPGAQTNNGNPETSND